MIVKGSDYGILVEVGRIQKRLPTAIIRGLKKRWNAAKIIEYAQSYS